MAKEYNEDMLTVYHDEPYNKIVEVAEARRKRRQKNFEAWLAGKRDSYLNTK